MPCFALVVCEKHLQSIDSHCDALIDRRTIYYVTWIGITTGTTVMITTLPEVNTTIGSKSSIENLLSARLQDGIRSLSLQLAIRPKKKQAWRSGLPYSTNDSKRVSECHSV